MITILHDIARAWDVSWWWFEHATGTDAPGSPEYNAWSGWVSDLGLLAVLGGMVHFARHANCGVKGCWRFSRHTYEMDGVTHKLCRKHHPKVDGAVTAAEVARHAEAQHLLDIHDAVKKPGTI